MNKKAITELAKSAGRFLWFGLIGLVVAWLQATFTSGNFDSTTVFVIGLVVKGLDRYVYLNKDIKLNGLAPAPLQK